MTQRPVVLCILDGIGLGRQDECDAVHLANTPNIDQLMENNPWCKLKATERLSDYQRMMTWAIQRLDTTQWVQDASSLKEQSWSTMPLTVVICGILLSGKEHTNKYPSLLGSISDGNVHSHIKHLLQMIAQADVEDVQNVRVHVLTDGRDVSPRSALEYIDQLEEHLSTFNTSGRDYRIATGGGRMWITLDRYGADW